MERHLACLPKRRTERARVGFDKNMVGCWSSELGRVVVRGCGQSIERRKDLKGMSAEVER